MDEQGRNAEICRFHFVGHDQRYFFVENMCEISIPIPNIERQQAIADLFSVYQMRKNINEKLKAQLKNICPILIKGSLLAQE